MKLLGGDWSKGDVIALAGLFVAVVGTIAAVMSIPGVRSSERGSALHDSSTSSNQGNEAAVIPKEPMIKVLKEAAVNAPPPPVPPSIPNCRTPMAMDNFVHIHDGNGNYANGGHISYACSGMPPASPVQAIISGEFVIDEGGNWLSLFASVNDGPVRSTDKHLPADSSTSPFQLSLPVTGTVGADGNVKVTVYVERAENSGGFNGHNVSAVTGTAKITVGP